MKSAKLAAPVPKPPPQELVLDYLAYRLDMVSIMLNRLATVDYKREFGVNVRDLRVLRFVAQEPGLIQGRLADLCLLEKGATSKLVTAMVRKGLLARQVGALDARHIELRLTKQGEKVVARCDEIGHSIEGELMDVLTANERAVFERCVQKLIQALRARGGKVSEEG
jgi:DNA-binding MarR family transcriptional regulator